MPFWVMLAVLSTLVAGVGLFLIGLRGKRVNDHPVCRKCRFDLVGLDAPESCPECGRSLAKARAIRRGARVRRPAMIALGGAMAIVPIVSVGSLVAVSLSRNDLVRYKPVWLLATDARMGSDTLSDAAAIETLRRYRAGGLSSRALGEMIDAGLDVQADRSRTWNERTWGELLGQAWFNGAMSDSQRDRLLANAFDLKITPRPEVAAGGVLPVLVEVVDPRIGPHIEFDGSLELESAWVGGESCTVVDPEKWILGEPSHQVLRDRFGHVSGGSERGILSGVTGGGMTYLALPESAREGKQGVTLRITAYSRDPDRSSYTLEWNDLPNVTREYEATVVVADDLTPVRLIEPTREQENAARSVFESARVTVQRSGLELYTVRVLLSYPRSALGFAFELEARTGGTLLGTSWVTSGLDRPRLARTPTLLVTFTFTSAGDVPETLDLVLTPSAEAARLTVDLDRIYGAPLTIEGLHVEHEAPMAPPRIGPRDPMRPPQ